MQVRMLNPTDPPGKVRVIPLHAVPNRLARGFTVAPGNSPDVLAAVKRAEQALAKLADQAPAAPKPAPAPAPKPAPEGDPS